MIIDWFEEEENLISINAVRRYDYKEYVRFCESEEVNPLTFEEWEEYMC